MTRRWLFSIILAGLALAPPAAASGRMRHGHEQPPGLTVTGAVTTTATYSLSQLQGEPLTTFTVKRFGWWPGSRTDTDQGVPVESLVNAAGPTLPRRRTRCCA
jgi:hypothetical protein